MLFRSDPAGDVSYTLTVNTADIQTGNKLYVEAERAEKLEKSKKQVEASNDYYNKDAKPGSLASKANMVARYNEKHNNK